MDTVLLPKGSNGGAPAAEEEEGSLIVSFVKDIISSVLDGGVNRGLVIGMHASFAGLFLVLVALWVLTEYNGHVLALSGISLCLWVTTGWFVVELQRAQLAQTLAAKARADAAARGEPSTAAATTATDVGAKTADGTTLISKEAAIAQFKKAVSEAKKTR